jgi:hypothetical protein
MSNNRKSHRRLPAAGPTPVGQRLRAQTIQGLRRMDEAFERSICTGCNHVKDWCRCEDEDDLS